MIGVQYPFFNTLLVSENVSKCCNSNSFKCCEANTNGEEKTTTASIKTASVPSYPTTFLLNSYVPSVVYESRIAAPVLSSEIPIIGIRTKKFNCECSKDDISKEEKEKLLDLEIKNKVREQIELYKESNTKEDTTDSCCCCCRCNMNEKKNKIKKEKEILDMQKEELVDKQIKIEKECELLERSKSDEENDNNIRYCCRKCPYVMNKELTLDEKIEKIRRELNLPSEKSSDKLMLKLDEEKRKARRSQEYDYFNKYDDYYTDKKACNHEMVEMFEESRSRNRNRSRSKSANKSRKSSKSAENIRSKSPTWGLKPPWVPTGQNYYYNTQGSRVELISKESNKSNSFSESKHLNEASNYVPSTYVSKESYYKPSKSGVYTVTTENPGKITIKTTVESKDYVPNRTKNSSVKEYYYPVSSSSYLEKKIVPLAANYVETSNNSFKTNKHQSFDIPRNKDAIFQYVNNGSTQYKSSKSTEYKQISDALNMTHSYPRENFVPGSTIIYK